MITYPNVKINLGLHVLRKREDGFHDLETLFIPYTGIHDTLEIITGDDYSRTSAALFGKYGSASTDEIPMLAQAISDDGRLMMTIARKEGVDWNPMDDLCAKAYRILADEYDIPPVKIFLEKTSPVGAGLGGGSADAAFALRMLNELFSLGLSDDALAGYAARLGSDCAFFIYNRPMIGRGRGEILSPFDLGDSFFGDHEIQVLAPEGISVSTAEAYRGISPRFPETSLTEALARPVEEWDGILVNDFETTVFAGHPELAAIKRSLYDSGAVYASMSGSGSALFAIYKKD
ncbi:MAG: 4-(cytidine 5'-diphospho)-2-C-methyl-D-erythritol kinase [Bacteroidales bacterium]|nr:4-(cytidine 5'-diphospho)-2-C-methyl-D-erythritol kinase [Bacteroidales bacterium]